MTPSFNDRRGASNPSSTHPAARRQRGRLFGLPEYALLLHGTTIKQPIHEEFGDGIMSAIDFKMDLTREPDPKGDRVKITMSGEYLQYQTY